MITPLFCRRCLQNDEKIIEVRGRKCADFCLKTVSCFFVYEPGVEQKLDVDSHDTKAIIDAIVGFLPCGDVAGFCDFSFVAWESTTLIAGTYICVSKGLASFQNDSVLEEFEATFPSKRQQKLAPEGVEKKSEKV